MLFTTFQFAIFLVVLIALMRTVHPRLGGPLLLGASLLFYTLWLPAYLPLLVFDIGVNYGLLRGIRASEAGSARRRLFLALSIATTLALLAYFKYAAFLVETSLPLLQMFSLDPTVPEVLLPLGISFYSFQIISLAVDTYRDDSNDDLSFGRYALYIAFFPQLIAGPILRGSDLLPQLSAGARPSPDRTRRGFWLLASGVSKKVVLADFLLAPFVDAVFDAPGVGNARFHWIALYAFSFQIYFDFSGYTDMARGIALLIGFELPENFHEPYLSRSPQEFWQRWHMTLSRWLRLYLFTPISRSLMRRGGPSTDRSALLVAQVATMTLCGLWHGAGWNFVLWGASQALLLIVWRRPRHGQPGSPSASDVPAILLFYNLFCLTLVFFRCPDLASAGSYFEGLFVPGELDGWPRLAAVSVVLCAALHVAERWLRPRSSELRAWCAARPAAAYLEAVAIALITGIAILVAGAGGEFIYFQF